MPRTTVYVVSYKLWPGMGMKGVASTPEGAGQIVAQCIKSYRSWNLVEPPHEVGFVVEPVLVDTLIAGTRAWVVRDGKMVEVDFELVDAQAAPEVPQVQG
jgi:hypothetical protein